MDIVVYHRRRNGSRRSQNEQQILDRAAHKGHLRRKTLIWDLVLIAFLGTAGPLLHCIAPLFAEIPVISGLLPVNESVWEHLKLLFFPGFLIAVLRRLFTGKLHHGVLTTYAEGLLLSMALMIAGFYTYSGILGTHTLYGDIALFYACTLFLMAFVRKQMPRQKKSSMPGLILLLLLTGCFFYFTYFPPGLGIFQAA